MTFVASAPGRPGTRNGGQLGISPVDLRVIQVRAVHPGLEVVGHQPGRDPAEERERLHMVFAPRLLIHAGSPAARTCAASTPAPSRTPTSSPASRPPGPATAQPPVIDLRLARRLGRLAAAPSPATGASPPALRATYRRKLVTLTASPADHAAADDRGHRVPRLQLLTDVLVMRARSPTRSPAATGYRPAPGTTPAPAQPTAPHSPADPPASSLPPPPRAIYFRVVFRSTPTLYAITLLLRPACQWCKISIISTTLKLLLAIGPPQCPGWGGMLLLAVMARSPARTRCAPHGELRDRAGELRDRYRATGGNFVIVDTRPCRLPVRPAHLAASARVRRPGSR